MKTIRLLLNSAIDYAGLFPPESLEMSEALHEYDECRTGGFGWALGRFIVPVSRLAELRQGIEALPPGDGRAWRLSVLGGTDPEADRERIFDFQHSAHTAVETVEWKPGDAGDIGRVVDAFSTCPVYFEIPPEGDARALIDEAARRGARAKVRTGGVTPGMFPSPAQLARFILLCAEAGVPFKATAGLHHPLRSLQPLIREPRGTSARMHGFLNVLLASAAACAGSGAQAVEQILEEESAGAFRFDDAGAGWREFRFPGVLLAEMRDRLFVSFGSCSFREPVSGMKALKLL